MERNSERSWNAARLAGQRSERPHGSIPERFALSLYIIKNILKEQSVLLHYEYKSMVPRSGLQYRKKAVVFSGKIRLTAC